MDEVVSRLMETNLLGVFNERDPDRRSAAIAATYADDVRWTDDEGVTVGHEQLNAKAQELQNGPLAGFYFAKSGPVRHTRGLGFLAWELRGEADDAVVMSGFDVATISGDRIDALWTVLTGEPA